MEQADTWGLAGWSLLTLKQTSSQLTQQKLKNKKLNQIKWTVMVGMYTCTPLAWSIKR